MPSFSSRTVVYKGLLLAPQVESFYADLRNPLRESALCLVHQRFSTNTFPSWKLAHPYRFIAHNGEINTVRGNVNWMYARRRTMESDLIATRTRSPSWPEEARLPGLPQFYMPSFSTRTVVYKGLLLAPQVGSFYEDLRNPLTESALALVHQRFSTNTFPSWKLAHPYRFIAHNGEINTVRGNVNWMYARRRTMESDLLGADLDKMWPLIPHGQSDTACLDNALELLVAGGYSLAHAMMMLIPEAWAGNPLMDAKRKAFYEYHAALMEPWDGPAAIAFTDGRQIGATLDRNGLRPARFIVTDDDLVDHGLGSPACCRSRRRRSSASGGCSPARCC